MAVWFPASKNGQGGPADWESQASSLRGPERRAGKSHVRLFGF